MPVTQKKKPVRKTPTRKKVTKKTEQPRSNRKFRLPTFAQIRASLARPFVRLYRNLRQRREESTHKSFVRTRKRDKKKIPKIEGFIAFPWYVTRILWNRKFLYLRLVLLVVVMSVVVVGAVQATSAGNLNSIFESSQSDADGTNPVMRALITVGSSMTGSLNSNLTDAQKLYMSAVYIIVLLTVVWLLRHQLAGQKVNVRDGLYSSSGPFAAEYVLILIGVIQLIPAAIAALLYSAGLISGALQGGIEMGMFSLALFFIVVLTLYFMTTTLFAMFIVTIPGSYPLRAYRAAREIVAGQRLRLLFRILWLVIIILIAWFIFLVPVVIIANSINVGSTIVIPIAVQTMLALSLVYGMAYLYLLYRRMIDDPADEK